MNAASGGDPAPSLVSPLATSSSLFAPRNLLGCFHSCRSKQLCFYKLTLMNAASGGDQAPFLVSLLATSPTFSAPRLDRQISAGTLQPWQDPSTTSGGSFPSRVSVVTSKVVDAIMMLHTRLRGTMNWSTQRCDPNHPLQTQQCCQAQILW